MDFWEDDDDDGLADFDVDAVVDHARARKDGGCSMSPQPAPREVVVIDDGREEEESLARRRARLLASTSTSGAMTITAPSGKFASANAKQISISSMFAVAAGTRAAPTTVAEEVRETLARATTTATPASAAPASGDGWMKTKRKGQSDDAPRKHQTTLPKELMIRSANDKRDLVAMATNLAPEALGEQDALGRTVCAGVGGRDGLPMDPQAVQTYVYPAQISRRQYQYDIARNALLTNSLVCLPTGLGKTLIAAVVMYNYYRWFPTGKIIFMAPTRPLVDQQMSACHTIVGIPASDTVVLMGSTKKDESGSRREFWRDKRLFFCTPHTVANDLNSGDLDANQVVCVVVDEAHHARGEYASAQVIRVLNERNINFRLLALTATPGQGIEEVQSVVETLRIGRIDFRSDQDPDVSRYTHKREMQVECVKPGQAISHVQDMLCDLLRPVCRSLLGMGAIKDGWLMKTFVDNKATNGAVRTEPPASFPFQQAQNNIQRGEVHVRSKGAAFSLLQQAMELTKSYELLLRYSPGAAYDYMEKRAKVNSNSLLHSRNQVAIEIGDMLRSMSTNGAHHSPKLDRLTTIIKNHFKHATADTRVIIFTSYRQSVQDIVRALREVPAGADTACKIKVAEFIGQSDAAAGKKRRTGGGDGRTTKGQSQKEQKRTLNDFRAGSLNTLVATSIGEEGLDIPSVDLIFFFDVVDIIRAIQRMGRTGRARDGKVVILATEGKEFTKFTSEQKKYENLMRCLRTPANHFKLEKNCPRIIPAGVTPVCELRMIEASPALKTTKSKITGKAKTKKPPGAKAILNAAMKIKDAPLDSATQAILFAYDYPQGSALAELDVAAAAPFLSRPDPVYAFEHGAWSEMLVNVMADLHGIPRVDPAGEAIPDGPCAKARAKMPARIVPMLDDEDFVVPDSQEPPENEEHVELDFNDQSIDIPRMEDYQWANDSQDRPAYEAEIKTSQEVMEEFTQMSDPKPRRISMHSVSPSVKVASQARLEAILAVTPTFSPKFVEASVEAELEEAPPATTMPTHSPNVIEASVARQASQPSDLDDDSDSEDQYLFLSKRKRTAARALKKITNAPRVSNRSPVIEASQKRSQERASMPPPPPRQTPQSGEKSTSTPSTGGSDDLCIKRNKHRVNARVLMSQFSPAERPAERQSPAEPDVDLVDIIDDKEAQRPRRRVRAPSAFKQRRNCFIDDEAEASDEEGGDDDERMTSGDERFIADSQEEEDDDDDDGMRAHPGMGFQPHTQFTPGSSGGARAHLATTFAALGPRERRVVQDTPSPSQRPSGSASKYDSSFIDDGSTMDDDADDQDASVQKPRRTDDANAAAPQKADGDDWDDWDDDDWGGDSQMPAADDNNDDDDGDDDGWGGDSQRPGEDSDGW